jgi:hypothetical protein
MRCSACTHHQVVDGVLLCRAPLPVWAVAGGVASLCIIADEEIARACVMYFPEPAKGVAQ